jgi:CHAT domain-containing protein
MDWHSVPRTEVSGLLICEPSTGRSRLANVADEVAMVRKCFEVAQAQVLNSPSAHTTRAQMHSALTGSAAHVLHIASHGVQETDPLRSAFLMEDGHFSIEDIINLHLPKAVLAFLSACQSAKGDANAPDQAVHLAASMLFCGFRSVIGMMW